MLHLVMVRIVVVFIKHDKIEKKRQILAFLFFGNYEIFFTFVKNVVILVRL